MVRTCCLLLALCVAAVVTAAERPNILFCMADDWGWPHAGVYGDEVLQTPAFDRLAREGALFHRAFVSSPSCTPSRNAIITGQQFYRLGQGASLHSTLDPRHPNFMFLLRDAGYQIGHHSKAWGPGDPFALGYTEDPCGPKSTFDEFLANRKADRPFCFWLGTHDPHRAYKKGSGEALGMDLSKVHVPAFYPDLEPVRSDVADYYFEVQRWNRDVAHAVELLEQAGLLENTIVVMTGDHGMPFPRCKGNLYDWGSRVPLAIRWGESIAAGQQFDEFVSLTDLAPTFLEAADVSVPESMTGKSLLPLVAGDEAAGRRNFVVCGRERHTPAQQAPSQAGYPARAIRTDRWLLILNLEPDRWPAGVPAGATHAMNSFSDCDQGPTKTFLMEHRDDSQYAEYFELCFAKRPAIELYDTASDPDQVNNIASDPGYADTVESLRTQLIEYLHATGDPRFTDEEVEFDEYPYRGGKGQPRR